MEESAPVESQGQLPSPHHGSLRRAVAAVLALDGESTLGRRKKRRKDLAGDREMDRHDMWPKQRSLG